MTIIPELHLDDSDKNTACYFINTAFQYEHKEGDDRVVDLKEIKRLHMQHIKILTDAAFQAGIDYAMLKEAKESS